MFSSSDLARRAQEFYEKVRREVLEFIYRSRKSNLSNLRKMLFSSALKIVVITIYTSPVSREEPGNFRENSMLKSGLYIFMIESLISLFHEKSFLTFLYNFNLHLAILRGKPESPFSNFVRLLLYDNPSSHSECSSACKFSPSSRTRVASIRAHPIPT